MELRIPISRRRLSVGIISAAVVFAVKELTVEFATDWIKSNVGFLADFLVWRWSSVILTIGILLLALLWACSDSIRSRIAKIRLTARPLHTRESIDQTTGFAMEKGLLDFIVEGLEAAKGTSKIMQRITQETEKYTKKLRAETKRVEDEQRRQRGARLERVRGIASKMAKDMDTYSDSMENLVGELAATNNILSDSFINWFEKVNPQTDDDKNQLIQFRQTISTMQ